MRIVKRPKDRIKLSISYRHHHRLSLVGSALSRLYQGMQRIGGPAAQFAGEQQPDEASPPPGRELKVSIESHQCVTRVQLRQRNSLIVDNPERQANPQLNPSRFRIHRLHFDGHAPATSER